MTSSNDSLPHSAMIFGADPVKPSPGVRVAVQRHPHRTRLAGPLDLVLKVRPLVDRVGLGRVTRLEDDLDRIVRGVEVPRLSTILVRRPELFETVAEPKVYETLSMSPDAPKLLTVVVADAPVCSSYARVSYPVTAPAPTLTEWVATWLPTHLAGAATLAKYESMLRCHILPAFGDRRLDAITRIDVKAFARSSADDLAPVTVRSIVTVLGLVLREAIDEHYLLFFDPTARLRLRDGPSEARPTATPAQVQLLAARMPNLQARMLVITAAYTGMRFGELAGLRRAHVHLDRALIHIAADTGALHEVSGDRWLGPPKPRPPSATSGYRHSWSTAWTGC